MPQKSIWDTVESKNSAENPGLDLAEFAAAAIRFRSETKEMSSYDSSGITETLDILGSLMSENVNSNVADLDDIKIPEWADYEEDEKPTHNSSFVRDDTNFTNLATTSLSPNVAVSMSEPSANGAYESLFSSSTLAPSRDSNRILTSSMANSLAEPLQSPPPLPWFYLDPQSNVQGPFLTGEMRNWLEAGYFKIDLPVKLESWVRFHPLGDIFPTYESAFHHNVPLEPAVRGNPISSKIIETANPNLRLDTYDSSVAHTEIKVVSGLNLMVGMGQQFSKPNSLAMNSSTHSSLPLPLVDISSPYSTRNTKVDISLSALSSHTTGISKAMVESQQRPPIVSEKV